MGRRYDTITFLSDLGTADESVGVVKAVLRDLAPHATVLDLTHEIRPFDVRAGSLALARAISYLPAGLVIAAVDPGVGSARRAVAVEVAGGDGVLIGPDNGVLAPAVSIAGGAGRCVVLDDPEHHLPAPGGTFAVRDVFAAAAAALCNGVELDQLGSPIGAEELVPGVVPLPRHEAGVMLCEVLWVDRFGNCQLNVGPDELDGWGDQLRATIGDPADPVTRVVTRVDHFAALGPGAVGLVVDAHGMLALTLDRRSAAEELRTGAGDFVALAPLGDDDGSSTAAGVGDHPDHVAARSVASRVHATRDDAHARTPAPRHPAGGDHLARAALRLRLAADDGCGRLRRRLRRRRRAAAAPTHRPRGRTARRRARRA